LPLARVLRTQCSISTDIALIDGTFYKDGELPGRNMSEIPHPFIEETIQYLDNLDSNLKKRIYFIHFNHTNPVLWDEKAQENLISLGYNFARSRMKL
jgi:pyrroloquinoline quinone biosynthesis protein B